jgi:hypothetical protein
MANKRFCKALCEEHDGLGKSLATDIMRDVFSAELVTNNEKEESGEFTDGFWDQMYKFPNETLIKVEPEMKNGKWFGDKWLNENHLWPFQYQSIDIPYRKKKNQAKLHIVISKCEEYACLVSRKAMDQSIEESGVKIKKTCYEPNGGSYFSVPCDRVVFLVKKDGKWIKFKKE